MPGDTQLRRYLPIAFIVVVFLMGLVAANPGAIFGLLDPAETLERRQAQHLYALGSADEPLGRSEAANLFERYQDGQRAAAAALVQQDANHGLPDAFLADLVSRFVEAGGEDHPAADLIGQLAAHRSFGEEVERVLVDTLRTPTGGVSSYPMETLGRLSVHRPLTEATLSELLDISAARGTEGRVALATLNTAANAHGLPDWALERLVKIAELHRGPARSEAIGVIASAGHKAQARDLLNTLPNPIPGRDAIASALPQDDLAALMAELENPDNTIELRLGALKEIVKRRDQTELVGAALTYAFSHEHPTLKREAFATFSEWGRHHARAIDVNWHALCVEGFSSNDPAMRYAVIGAFRFIPLGDRSDRDAFLLEMLNGTPTQQGNALAALSRIDPLSEPIQRVVVVLTSSPNVEIADRAGVIYERFRPRGRFEGLESRLAGALLWALLGLPALTAIGFETYYIARLFESVASAGRRWPAVLISIAWFGLSVALGLLLFAGVLGLGHGGHLSWEIYVLLLVINALFVGAGWLLALIMRRPARTISA